MLFTNGVACAFLPSRRKRATGAKRTDQGTRVTRADSSFGIFLCEQVFGPTIQRKSDGKIVPLRPSHQEGNKVGRVGAGCVLRLNRECDVIR